MLIIREENSQDHAAVRVVNRLAFGGEDEVTLVDRLRDDGVAIASLVAVENEEIVGHILFSRLPIETDRGVIDAVSLAPLAVLPRCQRQGIGTELVRKGMDVCRHRGETIVVVLGHREYYPRFGFSEELARKLHGPFAGPSWMAAELRNGALDNVEGAVRYPAAFGLP